MQMFSFFAILYKNTHLLFFAFLRLLSYLLYQLRFRLVKHSKMTLSFMKGKHTVGKQMAEYGSKIAIYQLLFSES